MIGFILKHPRLMGVIGAGAIAAGLFFAGRAWIASIEDAAFKRGEAAQRLVQLEQDKRDLNAFIDAQAAATARSQANFDRLMTRLDAEQAEFGALADMLNGRGRAALRAQSDYERTLNDLVAKVGLAGCDVDRELRDARDDNRNRAEGNW